VLFIGVEVNYRKNITTNDEINGSSKIVFCWRFDLCDSRNDLSCRFQIEATRIGIYIVGSIYEPPVEIDVDFYPWFVLVTAATNMIFTQVCYSNRQ
jgi:hypothetical protein